MPHTPAPAPDSDDESSDPGNLQDGGEVQINQTPPDTQDSSNDIAAFTISTARNLQLTTNGERSLVQFSQLDTRSALIYQQAVLIKLSEGHSRLEPATLAQGSGAGDRLVLTETIKKDIDYRIRLIILSPRLSRYRTLGKVSLTGPGGVLLEWLRSKSGIDKKYFEGVAFKELRSKVKASARYARSEVKDVIRRSVEEGFHITVLLRELAKSFEKWFKTDLKTPLALAVRFALLREVYHKDKSDTFWASVDKTLADVRQTAASGGGLSASEILVKCLDADEQKYPPTTGSAFANAALASIWQSQVQSSMDEFVSTSESTSE